MNQSLGIDLHSLAGLAGHYLQQISSVAFAARMTAKELGRDSQVEVTQAILEAIETLATAGQQALAEQCSLSEAFAAQQTDQEAAE